MLVTTLDQLITNLRWWKQMRVDGNQLIVQTYPVVGSELQKIVLADLKDEKSAQHLFSDINIAFKLGEGHFDIPAWEESRQAASGE